MLSIISWVNIAAVLYFRRHGGKRIDSETKLETSDPRRWQSCGPWSATGREPSLRAFVCVASGNGYALLETSMRSVLRLATIPSAETRTSQSASYNTRGLDFTRPATFDAHETSLRVPESVTDPTRWKRVGCGVMETRRPCPQTRVPHRASQSLSTTLLPRQSRGFSGRQLVGNPGHIK